LPAQLPAQFGWFVFVDGWLIAYSPSTPNLGLTGDLLMKYTEAVYKRKRRGKIIYDGVLTYYDDEGGRRFKHCERKTRGEALEALRDARKKLESGGSKAVESDRMTFPTLLNTVQRKFMSLPIITTLEKTVRRQGFKRLQGASETSKRLFRQDIATGHYSRPFETVSFASIK